MKINDDHHLFSCDKNDSVIFRKDENYNRNDLDNKNAFFYCAKPSSLVFIMRNCFFDKVVGEVFKNYWKYPNHLIHLEEINSILENNLIYYCTSGLYLIYCKNTNEGNHFNMSSNSIIECLHNSNFPAKMLIYIQKTNSFLENNTISNCIVYDTLIYFDSEKANVNFQMSANVIKNCVHDKSHEAKFIIKINNANSYLYDNNISNCLIYDSIISFENERDNIHFQMSSNIIKNCIHNDNINGKQIIYITKSNSYLYNNTILDCATYNPIINVHNENEGTYFNMSSNIITNCYNPGDKSDTILSNCYINDLQNNVITYSTDTSKSGRAFNIYYNSGCYLINDTVTNAFHKDGSAIILQEEHQNGNPSIIKDCNFINCSGDITSSEELGGLIIIIEKLAYDIDIINVSFKDTNPNHNLNKNPSNSFLIRFETNLDVSPIVNFSNCHFINLQNCKDCAAGGIGFIYKNNKKKEKTVIFDHSTFRHIINNNPTYGGGCLCIHTMPEVEYTNLILKGCNFYDIKSAASGGAVCFNSPNNELTVDQCTFNQVETTGESQFGGVIYVTKQKNYKPIIITNCIFNNTKSNLGGAIYIVREENSNSKITINGCDFLDTFATSNGHSIMISKTNTDAVDIYNCNFKDCGNGRNSFTVNLDVSKLMFYYNKFFFSNTEKNCGCIHLAQINEHEYFGNMFMNAQINDQLEKSAGINCDNLINPISIRFENNTFDKISGKYKGRCFFLKLQNSNNLALSNNTFQNCPSGGPLFGISFASSTNSFTIESTRFIKNSLDNSYDTSLGVTPQFIIETPINTATNYPDEFDLLIIDCLFYNNYNSNKGGALSYSLSNMMSNAKISLKKCFFSENIAEEGDGALSIHSYQGIECEECNFTKNKSNNGEQIVSIETYFNSKKSDQSWISPPSSTNPKIIFRECNFDNDESSKNEIYISSSPNTPVQIFQCNFIDSINKGYIVCIDDSNIGDVDISNSSFIFYNQEKSAAAIFSERDKIEIIGNTFQKCDKNTIEIECQPPETNSIHLIENNFLDCVKTPVIKLHYSITAIPIIQGNKFDNVVLNDLFFEFKLKNSIDSISFTNNTFQNFVQESDINGIGFKINNENPSISLHLTFEDCYFNNNKHAGAFNCDSNQNEGNTYLTMKECYFTENDNKNQGGAIYINIIHDIIIDTCKFISNSAQKGASIYIDPDFVDDTQKSSITITNCFFNKNTPNSDEYSSIYISSCSTKQLLIDFCVFEEDNGGVQIHNYNNNINIESNTFHNVHNGPSLYLTEKSRKTNIKIDKCIFDSCKGSENKCFYFLTETEELKFQNCVLQNLEGTGVNSYFGTFDVKDQLPYYLLNVSFINNTCDSLYGGGSGIKFIEFGSIKFNDCKFINNSAKQNKAESRPSLNGKNYYNGDGGAIQLGYHCKIYDMDVVFSDCIFQNNKAQRHGGAIAVQTYHSLSIYDCTFEKNIANYDFSSLSLYLLYNNYYDLKNDGRGGAVYINPSFSYDSTSECPDVDGHSSAIEISDCNFISNTAYDGYAFYIEGDDADTKFVISGNTFEDNYNESNHKLESNVIYGAVIVTEICVLQKEKIEKENTFKYSKEGLNVSSILCIDHYGHSPTLDSQIQLNLPCLKLLH